MKVLVSDTSVLIDLERASLLEATFKLTFELAVPDLIFERELREYGGNQLIAFGLRVEELDPEGVARALGYRQRCPSLSLPDSFALSLAKDRQCILLTGDGSLRGLAEDEAIECHGVLWILDQMNNQNVVAQQELRVGLQALASHPRCRLPQREINKRLQNYKP